MDRNQTIEEIKASLRREGYGAETIEGVLNEVRTSFLREHAESVIATLRQKADQLQDVLDAIYDALRRESVVDFRIPASEPLGFGAVHDYFDLSVHGSFRGKPERLTLAWTSRHAHPCSSPRRFALGSAGRPEKKESAPEDRIELAEIAMSSSPGEGAHEARSYAVSINASLAAEGDEEGVDCQARTHFDSVLAYLDYVTDMYSYPGFAQIAEELAGVHRVISRYFTGKGSMLGGLDFSRE